jgi:hypothetical protein
MRAKAIRRSGRDAQERIRSDFPPRETQPEFGGYFFVVVSFSNPARLFAARKRNQS